MIGSDRVRPGWAAMSFPAFSADCTRNMPSTPEATIAYSCQLVNIAPNPPCEKYVVIPFIRAAVSPKADPPAIPKTAAWWALLPWLPPPRPAGPRRPQRTSTPTSARFAPMPISQMYRRTSSDRPAVGERK